MTFKVNFSADDEAERKKKKVKSGGNMGLTPMQQLNHNSKNKEKFKGINIRPDGPFSINENTFKSLKDVCISVFDFAFILKL